MIPPVLEITKPRNLTLLGESFGGMRIPPVLETKVAGLLLNSLSELRRDEDPSGS